MKPSRFDQAATQAALASYWELPRNWVYFVSCAVPDQVPVVPVKIGYSKRPHWRLIENQTGCPFELVMLGVTLGGTVLEKDLHRQFKRCHIRGEWFDRKPEMEPFIDALTEFSPPEKEPKGRLPRELPHRVSVYMRRADHGQFEVLDSDMPMLYATFADERQAKRCVRNLQGKRRDLVLESFGLDLDDMRAATRKDIDWSPPQLELD